MASNINQNTNYWVHSFMAIKALMYDSLTKCGFNNVQTIHKDRETVESFTAIK